MEFKHRMLPSTVEPKWEWEYLANETYEGERCIVPLLRSIVRDSRLPNVFADDLNKQIEEEVEHVGYYNEVIGQTRLISSGYGSRLTAYVKRLPSNALKLFTLQGILEGIQLGTLEYRAEMIRRSPSDSVDKQVHKDELKHVSLSYRHFKELQNVEGVRELEEFKNVARSVNQIFLDALHSHMIAQLIRANHGVQVDPRSIESSLALAYFRKQSAHTIMRNRQEFLDAYFRAA